jgi:hypothetical protein
MLRDGSVEAEATDVGGWMGVEREPDHRGRCDQLHRTLKRIVKARGSLDLQEAAALREAQQLQIWRQFGHTSLVDYMEREMGYSPRAALERLRVANALPQLPQIAAAIEQGDLSFSGARELTRVATQETEQQWLGATADMNLREVEAAVSGHTRGDLPTDAPDPKLQRKILRYEVRPETDILLREAKRKLEKERGERVDEDAALHAIALFYVSGGSGGRVVPVSESRATERRDADAAASSSAGSATSSAVASTPSVDAQVHADALTKADQRIDTAGIGAVDDELVYEAHLDHGAAPYRHAVVTCRECKRGWLHAAGRESLMSPGAVEAALCDAQHIGDLDSPILTRAKQTIPPAMRRKVKHRDKGRCRIPGCRSSCNVDIHHLWWLSMGGTHDYNNLITLCEAHHIALHEGALHITFDPETGDVTVRREGRNAFTRATRAIEAAKALHAKGFDKKAVRAAIERTKTHVGTTEMTVEQWIEVAKRYLQQAGEVPCSRESSMSAGFARMTGHISLLGF